MFLPTPPEGPQLRLLPSPLPPNDGGCWGQLQEHCWPAVPGARGAARRPPVYTEPCLRAHLETECLADTNPPVPRPRPTYVCPPVTFPEEVRAGQTALISRLFEQVPGLLLPLFILQQTPGQRPPSPHSPQNTSLYRWPPSPCSLQKTSFYGPPRSLRRPLSNHIQGSLLIK